MLLGYLCSSNVITCRQSLLSATRCGYIYNSAYIIQAKHSSVTMAYMYTHVHLAANCCRQCTAVQTRPASSSSDGSRETVSIRRDCPTVDVGSATIRQMHFHESSRRYSERLVRDSVAGTACGAQGNRLPFSTLR